jgi:hypothetical protein
MNRLSVWPDLNLTLDMVRQTLQSSTTPWIGWVFNPTYPNPEYGQSDTAELRQPRDWLGISSNLTNGSAGQVELFLYD